MLHIDFSWGFDGSGRTATTTWREHKVDLIMQYLLTFPSERVNRPDFGTPLRRICFEGNSHGTAEVIQFIAKAGLHRWLSHEVDVVELSVESDDATLLVDLKYRIRGENEIREEKARFPLPGGAAQ